MVGTNIERERMPAGVEVRPIADLALIEAEPSVAKAARRPARRGRDDRPPRQHPQPAGFCSHTFVWEMEVLLDGESLSETQIYAQALAAEGIPILAAAGDRWLLEEIDEGSSAAPGWCDQGRRRVGRAPARSTRRTPASTWPSAIAGALPNRWSRRRPQLPGGAARSRSRARSSPAPPSPSLATS